MLHRVDGLVYLARIDALEARDPDIHSILLPR
jgi:hypothetical protein